MATGLGIYISIKFPSSLMDGKTLRCTVAWKSRSHLSSGIFLQPRCLVMIPTLLRSGSSKAEAPKRH